MRNVLQNQDRLCSLDEALASIVDRHPPIKDIATAYALLHKARQAVTQALPPVSLLGQAPGTTTLALGLPLLGELMDALATPSPELVARLRTAARLVLPAAIQAFPMLAEGLTQVAERLDDEAGAGDALATALVAAVGPSAEPGSMEQLAADLGLEATALHVAATESLLAILTHEAGLLIGLVDHNVWRRPHCPVCGGLPDVGILKEGMEDSEFLVAKAGQLWLHCGQCAALWRSTRLRCLSCGSEDPKDLDILLIEGDQRAEQEQAHLCKACMTYTTTVNMVDRLDRLNLEMLAMRLLPLELLAQERGYAPLAPSPWNKLS